MTTKAEAIKVYEMLLSTPGMNEEIRLTLRLTRKNVLFMTRLMTLGLSPKKPEDGEAPLMAVMNTEIRESLLMIHAQLLEQSGLKEVDDRLQAF